MHDCTAVYNNVVDNNPHITDWYFTSRVSDFVDHWLHDALDVD